MNSRHVSASESLDLLLDTICNSFGSIVFIALLVVILVRRQSEDTRPQTLPPTQVSQSRLIQLRIEHLALQEQLRRLQQLNERAATESSEDKSDLLAQIERLERVRDQLARVKHHAYDSLAHIQVSHNELVMEVRRLQEELDRVSQAVQNEEQELKRLEQENQRVARLPKLAQTEKREAAFLLTGGTIYAVHRPGRHNNARYEPFLRWSDECEIVSQGNTQVILPRSGKGLAVPLDGNLELLRRKLERFNAQTDYLAVFVWPDSFAHWNEVHKVIEELGFQYALLPMEEDVNVVVGKSTGKLVQ